MGMALQHSKSESNGGPLLLDEPEPTSHSWSMFRFLATWPGGDSDQNVETTPSLSLFRSNRLLLDTKYRLDMAWMALVSVDLTARAMCGGEFSA